MKSFLLVLLLAGPALLPLRATNFVLNSDFGDGLDHGYGNARTPADFAKDNGQMAPDPAAKGVIMTLRGRDWGKLAQDFQGDINDGTITITLKASAAWQPSMQAGDYDNVPNKNQLQRLAALRDQAGQLAALHSRFRQLARIVLDGAVRARRDPDDQVQLQGPDAARR
jgi:hypothetical protein